MCHSQHHSSAESRACYVKLRSRVLSFEVEDLILCGRLRKFIQIYLFTTGELHIPGLKSFSRYEQICRDDVADQNNVRC